MTSSEYFNQREECEASEIVEKFFGFILWMDGNGDYRLGFDTGSLNFIAIGTPEVMTTAIIPLDAWTHVAVWVDKTDPSGGVFYLNGLPQATEVVASVPPVSTRMILRASPNPFNSTVRVGFTLPTTERVLLAVYDVSGRRLKTLRDSMLPAGRYEIEWDGRTDEGRPASSGTYFVRLESSDTSETVKAVLLR